jgi:LemA protein
MKNNVYLQGKIFLTRLFNKKQNRMTVVILLVIVVILLLFLIGLYNRLVGLRNRRESAFANIDVQLRQRYDLVPQLVATVKGYATHEREVLEKITESRSKAMNATSIDDKIAAENQFSSVLAGLKVSLEAYPDLKANQNFLQLQTELADIENKLAATRRFFNSTTMELNTAIQSFPSNIIANMFGFHREPMFEIPKEQRVAVEQAPKVEF